MWSPFLLRNPGLPPPPPTPAPPILMWGRCTVSGAGEGGGRGLGAEGGVGVGRAGGAGALSLEGLGGLSRRALAIMLPLDWVRKLSRREEMVRLLCGCCGCGRGCSASCLLLLLSLLPWPRILPPPPLMGVGVMDLGAISSNGLAPLSLRDPRMGGMERPAMSPYPPRGTTGDTVAALCRGYRCVGWGLRVAPAAADTEMRGGGCGMSSSKLGVMDRSPSPPMGSLRRG